MTRSSPTFVYLGELLSASKERLDDFPATDLPASTAFLWSSLYTEARMVFKKDKSDSFTPLFKTLPGIPTILGIKSRKPHDPF